MTKIIINGRTVDVGVETLRRIEKIAEEKKITLTEAVSFCLEKVI